MGKQTDAETKQTSNMQQINKNKSSYKYDLQKEERRNTSTNEEPKE